MDKYDNDEFECITLYTALHSTLHAHSDIAFPIDKDSPLRAQGNRRGGGSLSLGRGKFS